VVSVDHLHHFLKRPLMIGHLCGSGWSRPGRRELPAEIVVDETHGQRFAVIFELLAECLREAGEPTIPHPNREV